MIAVFVNSDRDFHEFAFTPREHFIRIRKVEDIRARTFTGIILYNGWYKTGFEIQDAYNALKQRQPKLFTHG